MAVPTSLSVGDWHRLNRLLEQALELEGAARSVWLEVLSDDDRHLRAVLVERRFLSHRQLAATPSP